MKVDSLYKSSRKERGSKAVVTIQPNESSQLAMLRMKENGIHHLPVVENGRVIGIISDRDITKKALENSNLQSLDWPKIADAMRKDAPVISEDTEVGDALQLMFEGHFSALAIVDGDALRGIVTESDLLKLCATLLAGSESKGNLNPAAVYFANPLAQKVLSLLSDLGI